MNETKKHTLQKIIIIEISLISAKKRSKMLKETVSFVCGNEEKVNQHWSKEAQSSKGNRTLAYHQRLRYYVKKLIDEEQKHDIFKRYIADKCFKPKNITAAISTNIILMDFSSCAVILCLLNTLQQAFVIKRLKRKPKN